MEAHPKGTCHSINVMEARTGIEPVHGGFADPCVTASPPRRVKLGFAKAKMSLMRAASDAAVSYISILPQPQLLSKIRSYNKYTSYIQKNPIKGVSMSINSTSNQDVVGTARVDLLISKCPKQIWKQICLEFPLRIKLCGICEICQELLTSPVVCTFPSFTQFYNCLNKFPVFPFSSFFYKRKI